jgi:hypothetical protein
LNGGKIKVIGKKKKNPSVICFKGKRGERVEMGVGREAFSIFAEFIF